MMVVLISECFPRVSLERSVCIYTQTVSLMLNAQGRIVHSPTQVKEMPPPQWYRRVSTQIIPIAEIAKTWLWHWCSLLALLTSASCWEVLALLSIDNSISEVSVVFYTKLQKITRFQWILPPWTAWIYLIDYVIRHCWSV